MEIRRWSKEKENTNIGGNGGYSKSKSLMPKDVLTTWSHLSIRNNQSVPNFRTG